MSLKAFHSWNILSTGSEASGTVDKGWRAAGRQPTLSSPLRHFTGYNRGSFLYLSGPPLSDRGKIIGTCVLGLWGKWDIQEEQGPWWQCHSHRGYLSRKVSNLLSSIKHPSVGYSSP